MAIGEQTVGLQTSAFPTSLRTFDAQDETNDAVSDDPEMIEGREFNLPAAEIMAVQATLGASPRGLVTVAGTTATVGSFRTTDGPTSIAYAGGTLALTPLSTNYLYLDLAGPTLAKSTVGWPATKHVPLATWPGSGTTVTDARPHLPAAGSSGEVVRGYIDGLRLTNDAGDPDNDIGIAAGKASDATHLINLTLPTALVKKIDAAWAVGTAAGGFAPAGAVAVSTWYYVHLIRKTSDGSIDVMFDSSLTAANIPTGYAAYRRIGAVLTTSGGTIRQFWQWGDEFLWDGVDRDAHTTTLSTARATLAVRVPPGFNTMARLRAQCSHATPGTQAIVCPVASDDDVPGAGATDPGVTFFVRGAFPEVAEINVLADAAGEVAARSTASSTTLSLFTIGYRDSRGRDA